MLVVVAEHADQKPLPVNAELAEFARRFQPSPAVEIQFVVIDQNPEAAADRIAAETGCNVMGLQVPGLSAYNGEVYCRLLATLCREMRPELICTAHSYQGLDFAPALSARLHAACVTGVDALQVVEGHLCLRRPVHGGKLVQLVAPRTETTVVTVQPGVFRPERGRPVKPGSVTIETRRCRADRMQCLQIKPPQGGASAISEADVVVAAGRGIGEVENLELIRQLAAVFPKSTVAGSRIVCDAGWLEYNRQVGITGATVTPSLYIACGISGAVQHVTGMRGAGFVVAINTDPQAAIFNEADVCVVEDLRQFIPAFVKLCRPPSARKEESHD
jgi:electron transfer flavoprotein alpha subunit